LGCVDKRNTPSVSRFERGRGSGGMSTEETPLRLAFRAREGWRVTVKPKGWEKTTLILAENVVIFMGFSTEFSLICGGTDVINNFN
jgi:hypothetical protein